MIGNGSRYKLKRGSRKLRNILKIREITTTKEIAEIVGSTINKTAAVVHPIHDKWNIRELKLMECNFM